jgi:hypothetical protein
MSFCQQMLARNNDCTRRAQLADLRQPIREQVHGCGNDARLEEAAGLVSIRAGSRRPTPWKNSRSYAGSILAKLTASVERFNGFARKGVDEDFNRGGRAYDRFLGDKAHAPSPSMGTIEKGPFYAYQFYPGDVGHLWRCDYR